MDDYRGVLRDIEELPYFKGVEMVETKREYRYKDVYPVSEEMRKRIDRDFTYHAPNQLQIERYQVIRETARGFAEMLIQTCPNSRELSLALTDLEMCVAHANMAIARHE